jgi:hypothetical protein
MSARLSSDNTDNGSCNCAVGDKVLANRERSTTHRYDTRTYDSADCQFMEGRVKVKCFISNVIVAIARG